MQHITEIKMVKKSIIAIIFLIAGMSVQAIAETVIKGRVQEDKDKSAVEFANIVVYRTDGRLVKAGATDKNGEFALKIAKDGEYRLLVSFIGFENWAKTIQCEGGVKDLGIIRLKEGRQELDASGITAKSLIKLESDRIVYDVSADPDAARMSMAAFMAKIPGLKMSVKDGNLEFRDTPLNRILIDDKDNGLINAGRQYPMSFIKADYMSKIELILPGSPEYNNNSPILAVTLDKPLPFGAAGQLKGFSSSLNRHEITPDAVVNTPLVGVGLKYSFNYEDKPSLANEYSRTCYDAEGAAASHRDGGSEERSDVKGHNLNMNIFRNVLKDKLRLNASFSTLKSENHGHSSSSDVIEYADGGVLSSSSSTNVSSVSPFRFNAGFKANYDWKRGNGITLKYTFRNLENSSDEIISPTDAGNDRYNHSFRTDRQQNIAATTVIRDRKRKLSFRLEAGYMFRDYDDRTEYWNGDTGGLDYRQGVLYADAVMSGNFLKRRLSYSIRLNAEDVINRGDNLLTAEPLDYEEFNLIPTVSISWAFKNEFRLWASYNCFSRRPTREQLDPYLDTSDPYNIRTGNPDLKGQVTHSMSMAFSKTFSTGWVNRLALTIDDSLTPDSIEAISSVDADNVRTTTYGNIGRLAVRSLNFSGDFRPAEPLTIGIKADYRYSAYKISGDYENSFSTFSVAENASLNLKSVYISQNLVVYPYSLSAQSKSFTMEPRLDLTVSKYWEKAHLGGTLGVEDLLHGRSYRRTTLCSPGFLQESLAQRAGRMFYVSVYWRIGKFRQTETVAHSSYDLD